jgi:hypothetical protein
LSRRLGRVMENEPKRKIPLTRSRRQVSKAIQSYG